MKQLQSASFVKEMREKLATLELTCIHRENNNINAENCTGDYLTSSKNCEDCYESKGSEDCKRLLCSKLCKDSQDLFGFGYDSQLLYESVGSGLSTQVAFSWICETANDSYYCLQCSQIEHCFGCISLRRKKYCIFNKQYTKEEYEVLMPKIIEQMRKNSQWGEFLPWSMSPFTYNETVANEFLPLTKKDAVSLASAGTMSVLPPQPLRKPSQHRTSPMLLLIFLMTS